MRHHQRTLSFTPPPHFIGCRQMTLATLLIVAATMGPGEDNPRATTERSSADRVPPTRREDHVDRYHGVDIADPYRWLEVDVRESPEVRAWVETQNAHTQRWLQSVPQRE